jgi:hypothetical protein
MEFEPFWDSWSLMKRKGDGGLVRDSISHAVGIERLKIQQVDSYSIALQVFISHATNNHRIERSSRRFCMFFFGFPGLP